MAFVYTDCNTNARLPPGRQDARYKLAINKGGALSDQDYEVWRQLWNNPLIAETFLPATYGENDKELKCLSLDSEADKKMEDAKLSHCWYRMGEMMKVSQDQRRPVDLH
jgi:hypothetical protein